MANTVSLPYDPSTIKRELAPFYISASEQELEQMYQEIGASSDQDLYAHIPSQLLFSTPPALTANLGYQDLANHLADIASMNRPKPGFIGDGLINARVHEIAPFVASLRGLTTAYTPYQPERSQGTLWTLWVYSSMISKLTGFEAINASFYDRSTCMYEACNTAIRLKRGSNTILIVDGIYPGDKSVLQTQAEETNLNLEFVPLKNGEADLEALKEKIELYGDKLAALVFPQTNHFGNLENVDLLTDLAGEHKLSAIAVIDPMLLATGGLKAPSTFGSNQQGCDMIVGEGQHLAIAPNFGGPGLGLFGIRFNDQKKNDIRSTAGRFVGKTVDEEGNECLAMVLSTREQHIRREKATSNICSNQSFVATMAGASLLARGENGTAQQVKFTRDSFTQLTSELLSREGISLAFPASSNFNQITLDFGQPAKEVITAASKAGLHLGVAVSERGGKESWIQLTTSDVHTKEDMTKLNEFLDASFPKTKTAGQTKINNALLRQGSAGLPQYELQEIKDFYVSLAAQNVSPDDAIYPLGSCTMKYNPHINDWAAGLPGFTDIHPQAPLEDAQGCLKILHEIQEAFKAITGLPAVTTQPVAGAQGELVGIKMFQAYHRSKGEESRRDIILIPSSAHGTNPATATMAGFETKKVGDIEYGIIPVSANDKGQIDFDHLTSLVQKYSQRIAGIMVTNPNTAGLFETRFKEMADLIHGVDGLVYMDGANMNAIAGYVNLDAMGVDAVHNNLHKTWTIPHGGGGPGDAIVAVSSRIADFMPGIQVIKKPNGSYSVKESDKGIGNFHRHFGNFAHKVRAYAYIKALGPEGVRKMSAVAVLSAKYLYSKLKHDFPTLPAGSHDEPRMHEFILTLSKETFDRCERAGVPKANVIAKVGKLFLDFGLHAPTVAFPEQYGLMIEPTESFTKAELDRFIEVVQAIYVLVRENPEVLTTAPHFTPISKVDEVAANKNLVLSSELTKLPLVLKNRVEPGVLGTMPVNDIIKNIIQAHKEKTKH
tara:strand:- start:27555 stop:30560 length:3006 start_codon:yes stop_codon:yes gene_type:complete